MYMSSLLVAESVWNGFSSVKNTNMFVKKANRDCFFRDKIPLSTLATTNRLGLYRIRL